MAYNRDLPKSAEYGRIIPQSKFFLRTITSPALREIYSEQIHSVSWTNKLSPETMNISSGNSFNEIEVFDIALKSHSLDKRLLQKIDKGIPYYVFHILGYKDRYQSWIANKRNYNGKVKVDNYLRTLWLEESEFCFSLDGSTIENIYTSLKEQVEVKRKHKIVKAQQLKECNDFMNYFRTMKMTRSYKPVLILATIQAGGTISVEQAASYFVKFYKQRKEKCMQPEFGNCIYSDKSDNHSAINSNFIHNPIDALCHSGFFDYDSKRQVFSFSSEIYDGLTLDEIDEIGKLCNIRLHKYFND